MTRQDGIDPSTLAGLRAALAETSNLLPLTVTDNGDGWNAWILDANSDTITDSPDNVGCGYDREVAELIVDAINALPDLIKEAEAAQKMRAALAQIEGMAGGAAIGAHARGQSEEERRWLDVVIVLERADLLETGGQS